MGERALSPLPYEKASEGVFGLHLTLGVGEALGSSHRELTRAERSLIFGRATGNQKMASNSIGRKRNISGGVGAEEGITFFSFM